jgi:hypothetical protein
VLGDEGASRGGVGFPRLWIHVIELFPPATLESTAAENDEA